MKTAAEVRLQKIIMSSRRKRTQRSSSSRSDRSDFDQVWLVKVPRELAQEWRKKIKASAGATASRYIQAHERNLTTVLRHLNTTDVNTGTKASPIPYTLSISSLTSCNDDYCCPCLCDFQNSSPCWLLLSASCDACGSTLSNPHTVCPFICSSSAPTLSTGVELGRLQVKTSAGPTPKVHAPWVEQDC